MFLVYFLEQSFSTNSEITDLQGILEAIVLSSTNIGACCGISLANSRGTEPTVMDGTSGISVDVVHETLAEGWCLVQYSKHSLSG